MIFDVIRLARTRDEVVPDYAELLGDMEAAIEIDWPAVNTAITAKWSPAGLRYIKIKAWAMAYPTGSE